MLFIALLFTIINIVPHIRNNVQHLELIIISLMIMISLVIMLFWSCVGVLGGLISFLVAMIFLYKPFTALNPYYYAVLILAFFLNSFIGYFISKKIGLSSQDYTVSMEKKQGDTNLITNHMKNREAEVRAMGDKIDGLLNLKNISDSLSCSLSEEEVIKVVMEKTFDLFGGQNRVLLYMVDYDHKELNLCATEKAEERDPVSTKKGGIFDRWVMKNVKSLLIKDVKKDFRFSADEEEAREDFTSLISKPLIVEGNVLGILRVDNPKEEAFAQHEFRILDIIGELGAVALENARLYRQTEELAIRDGLTGLYVRRYFMERMDEELKRSLISGGSFALLMLDIDDFKDFNDKYGHVWGDSVLKNIGNILKSKTSPGDMAGRYGGEEFTFLALNCTMKDAVKLANEIREEVKRTSITLRRKKYNVTISIGVAMFPKDAKLREDIIGEADKRLYRAKAKGKDMVCSK